MSRTLDRAITGAKQIVLITSGQPSLNPRLVKEADALAGAGYQVTVLYAYWNEWGTKADDRLLPQKQWKAIRVAGDPIHKPLTFFFSRLIHKAATFLSAKFSNQRLSDLAIARSSFFLTREAKKHKADIFIGHNLGALPATIEAAKANGALSGFDAEDFHRYEISNDDNTRDVRLKIQIENNYIPQLAYLTTSSPGISDAYKKLYPQLEPVTILNVFPTDKKIERPATLNKDTLKLFWFSQTISEGRGLNDCLEALSLIDNPNIELNLLGFSTAKTRNDFNSVAAGRFRINFIDPVSPDAVISLASDFDIGLASEDKIPFNRELCLTNKIFSYMQAGLAIVASDTLAQQHFLNVHPAIGKVYNKAQVQTLANYIEAYFNDRDALLIAKQSSFDIARACFNWEQESQRFVAHIKALLPA